MKTILIIDDEEPIRLMLRKFFTNEGFSVITAENGERAVAVCKNHNVDLVVVDIIMPEKEGIETITELKKKYSKVKIIAISGGGKLGPHNYLKLAALIGANDTMEKPLDLDLLMLKVNNLLK